MGGRRALALWDDVLAPACLSVDNPRYLSFIPSAPTRAAAAFDMLVGVSSVYGGSWLEGSGAVYAENQALRWIADLCGLPATSGGVFVQGGTGGNLSALVAAREARQAHALDTARTVGGLRHPGDALVGQARAARRHGRRRRRGARRRPRAAGRHGPRADGTGARPCGARRHLRGRRHGRQHQPRHRRRPRRHRRGRPRARLVVPRRRCVRRRRTRRAERPPPLRRHRAGRLVHRRPAQVAVRARSTAARCSTATRPTAGPRTPSTPTTSTRSPSRASGTRPTTRSSSAGGPAACRSGSPSPCTAPTPTAKPSSRR